MKSDSRSGWGRNLRASVTYLPLNPKNASTFGEANSGLAVGLGRSYGDSSLNSEGITWTTNELNHIQIFPELSFAICGSGVTIGQLERAAMKYGLFPPVVPGTEYVTVGGAIASNVHGKSHHTDGSFGDHVIEITIINSRAEEIVLSPEGNNSKEFWATVGGLGLTGAIVKAKIALKPIETNFMEVYETRVRDFNGLLEKLKEFDSKYSHTVAWVDLSGSYVGRGIVSGANFASRNELDRKLDPFQEKLPRHFSLPRKLPFSLINNLTVRLFNTVWYWKPKKRGLTHFQPFLHPLDSIQNWNSIYGKAGFLQYQFVVPYGEEKILHDFLELMKLHRVTSFLTVLKRLNEQKPRFLSFPIAGWTLSIDFPASHAGFIDALNDFDERLASAGGRVYLTKDSRVKRDRFEEMYLNVSQWKEVKSIMDPGNYWKSEQGNRLGLC